MSKVRVINLVPGSGITLRAPPVSLAHDSAHHATPQDLELLGVVNENIERATVDHWSQNTTGLRFEQFGDTVLSSVDTGLSARDQLKLDRIKLERKRIADERAALDRERRRHRTTARRR
jgi:hypothetical protein